MLWASRNITGLSCFARPLLLETLRGDEVLELI